MNTVTLQRNTLRPSNLDKLSRCSWFKSRPAGPAAGRGTQIDDLLRAFFCDEGPKVPEEFQWGFAYAVKKTYEIAGEAHQSIIAAKRECVINVPGLPQPAECDCIIRPRFTSIDWKSGQLWDYSRQQAAYAYGQMCSNFALSWTAVCIYYDKQETIWHRYTFKEAREIVETEVARYANPEPPSPNEFCPWCANFDICPAQRELAAHALTIPDGALDFEAVKADPELLGKFLAGCHTLEHYEKEGREAALEWMLKKRQVPSFSLQKGRRSRYVPPETLIQRTIDWTDQSPEAINRALRFLVKQAGPVSEESYLNLCGELGAQPDPTDVKEQVGQPFIRFNGKKQQRKLEDESNAQN